MREFIRRALSDTKHHALPYLQRAGVVGVLMQIVATLFAFGASHEWDLTVAAVIDSLIRGFEVTATAVVLASLLWFLWNLLNAPSRLLREARSEIADLHGALDTQRQAYEEQLKQLENVALATTLRVERDERWWEPQRGGPRLGVTGGIV